MELSCPNCERTFEAPADATEDGEQVCPHCRSGMRFGVTDQTMALSPGQIEEVIDSGEAASRAQAENAAAQPGQASSPKLSIEGYALLKKLGEGGMGSVYLARQLSLDRSVAIKVLHQQFALDQDYLDRFMREAKLVAKLDHPNVVRALDAGESGGFYYLIMEYIEGDSLQQIINEKNKLPEAEALGITAQILKALEFANSKSIVHRDIKPDNILIDKTGVAKLADLGLAKEAGGHTDLTQSGTMMGTPHYMSPEQAEGNRDLDVRSDLYSLGATLFRTVTGKPPFDGQTAAVIVALRLAQDPPEANTVNPEVSAACSRLIKKMMSRDRNMRHQTPEGVARDIARILGEAAPAPKPPADQETKTPPEVAPPPPTRQKPRLPKTGQRRPSSQNLSVAMPEEPEARRRPVKLIVGVVAAVALIGLLAFTTMQWLALSKARASFNMRRYAEARERAVDVWHPFWSSEAQDIARHAALYVDLKQAEEAGNWAVARDTVDVILKKCSEPDTEPYRRKRARYDYRYHSDRALNAENKAGLDPRKWTRARELHLRALGATSKVEGMVADAQHAEAKSAFCLYISAGLAKMRERNRTGARKDFEAALKQRDDEHELPEDLKRVMQKAGVNRF